MKRLGLGDLGAGWRKDATHASEKLEGLVVSQQQVQNCPETALVTKCPIIAFSNRIICNLTANLNRYRYNKLIYSINLLFLFVYTPRKSGFLS
jgi:hypothetical protein